jgi:hypothetical protein
VSVLAYQTVVGRPTLGLASLARHGKVGCKGKKIDRGMKGKLDLGGRKMKEARLTRMKKEGGECRAEGKQWK